MLVAVWSAKGSPGVTASALTLAAAWQRPVVLLEADPSGGDLAYRCQAASGGPVFAAPNLLTLAAAIRGDGIPSSNMLSEHAQRLQNGVHLVQGVTAPTQGRGLGSLWGNLAQACQSSSVDVIADLGRLDRTSPALAIAEAADLVLAAASSSLESVMHLREALGELVGVLNTRGPSSVVPLIVSKDAHAVADCADLDQLLAAAGIPVQPTQHLPYDPKALDRLERGESAGGRLGRTLLIRAGRALAASLVEREGVPA